MSQRTASEQLFQRVFDSLGIQWRRVAEGAAQTPDYCIEIGGTVVFAEVKQLDENAADKQAREDMLRHGSAAIFPQSDKRIREKINRANSQLKRLTNEQYPGILVLYSNTFAGDYDVQDLHDAMFGSETHRFAVAHDGSGKMMYLGAALAGDGKMKVDRNTSTSAILSLRSSGDRFTLTFYHNKYAKLAFVADWLRGESIQHFASLLQAGRTIPGWVAI